MEKNEGYENDIGAELQKADPDWNKIKSDLSNMRFGIREILSVANTNHIKFASDPNFLEEMSSMSTLISSMEQAVGDPEKMTSLLGEFSEYMMSIYQDFLQG